MKKKNILVTGGRGNIGSAVVRELARQGKYHVYSTYYRKSMPPSREWRQYATFISADLTSKRDVEKVFARAEFFAVIHLAAVVRSIGKYKAREATILTENLKIDAHVFSEVKRRGIKRIVVVSTHDLLHTEHVRKGKDGLQMLAIPDGAYEFSRLVTEKLCRVYQEQYGIEYVIMRPVEYSYGSMHPPMDSRGYPPILYPGIQENELQFGKVPQVVELIRAVIAKKTPILTKGDPDSMRYWTHFTDLARAIILAAEVKEAKNQEFEIGTGEGMSVRAVTNVIQQLIYPNQKQPLDFVVQPFAFLTQKGDYEKAQKLLGWKPTHTLKKDLPEMIAWVKRYFM